METCDRTGQIFRNRKLLLHRLPSFRLHDVPNISKTSLECKTDTTASNISYCDACASFHARSNGAQKSNRACAQDQASRTRLDIGATAGMYGNGEWFKQRTFILRAEIVSPFFAQVASIAGHAAFQGYSVPHFEVCIAAESNYFPSRLMAQAERFPNGNGSIATLGIIVKI
ncbi:hypothetical protein W97_06753 [Coniosporium apollinis CBS 100218]|uniref:Uncharacterized protein n=1 Tax=Coniosporium apollinis (strain CBS 100218) TaxID=1168221 RepID=R7Z0C4_CONA1|nr:uncharacterized protein W97_06753 [Coniosporium apollinis CBS 100218]EON67499.1 hypothetical protein W97_06753 [Coniosporium apollinis CBS 100218]